MNLHEEKLRKESTIEGAMELCKITRNRRKEIEAEMVGLWLLARITIQLGGRLLRIDSDEKTYSFLPPSMRRLFREAQRKLAQKQKEKLRKMLARRKKDEAKHGKIISRQLQAEYDSKTGKLVMRRKVTRVKETVSFNRKEALKKIGEIVSRS